MAEQNLPSPPYKQSERKKKHMIILLDAEKPLKNPTLLYDKGSGENRDTRNIP